MEFKLSEEFKKRAQVIMSGYPDKNSALLPLLHLLQSSEGFISEEMIDALSEFLSIPQAEIKGVLSFYTMFNRKPVGRFHIQVCRNLSCSLMGAEHLLEVLKKKLNIDEGGTTPDGLFTLSTVECLGSCGTAPVMMINDDYYENITEEKLEGILEEMRRGKDPA